MDRMHVQQYQTTKVFAEGSPGKPRQHRWQKCSGGAPKSFYIHAFPQVAYVYIKCLWGRRSPHLREGAWEGGGGGLVGKEQTRPAISCGCLISRTRSYTICVVPSWRNEGQGGNVGPCFPPFLPAHRAPPPQRPRPCRYINLLPGYPRVPSRTTGSVVLTGDDSTHTPRWTIKPIYCSVCGHRVWL